MSVTCGKIYSNKMLKGLYLSNDIKINNEKFGENLGLYTNDNKFNFMAELLADSNDVYIYDDRIEIVSNGGLPSSLSKEDFYAGISKPINKKLLKIFGDLDYIDQTGHGKMIEKS